MKIGILGAGKVGTTLGKYLTLAGITVTGFYSRTKESADEAATFTNTKSYQTISALVEASDTLFITTPDGTISQVWEQIAQFDLKDYIICHFSGSLSSHVFSGIEKSGATGCSIHPMYAFSDKFTSYQQFHKAWLTMEGDAAALHVMQTLFEGLGHQVRVIRSDCKIKYHAAAALASNEMLAVMQAALDLLADCGFSQGDSLNLLRPLVEGNMQTILEKGCVQALTGPVERGDVETVSKHLVAIKGTDTEKIYRALGGNMLRLASQKNPERDYTALKKILL